jgi:hypothetical protein
MKTKNLKINFRYLCGDIACLSVDSTNGEVVHNDIDNEEAIIIFNSLIGEKENCQTVKTLLKKYKKQKEIIEKAKEFINENKDKYYQDWGQDDSSVDIYLNEYEIKELLDILKEVE